MSFRHSAAKSLAWTAFESMTLSGISFLTLIVFAWFLSPVQMGVGAIALGIVQLMIVPVEVLFQDALIQRTYVEEAHFDTAFTVTVALGVAMLGLACACSGLLARAVGIPEVAPVFVGMSFSLIPMSFASVVAARQRRDFEFRSLALRSMVGRMTGAFAGIGLAWWGAGVWALVAQQILLVGLASAVLWMMAERRPRFHFSRRHFGDLIGFGLRSACVMSVNVAVTRVYVLLLGALLGAADVGYINIAFRAVDMLRDVIAGAVAQLALPLFGRLKDGQGGLASSYVEATSFTCLVGFPIFAGISICAPEIVSLLFGPRWLPSVPYVALFGILVLPYFARLYIMPCVAAGGHPQAALPSLLSMIAFLVVGMLLIGRVSLPLAALVWTGRLLLAIPIDAVILRRVCGIGIRAQTIGIWSPLLAVAGMLIALSLERLLLEHVSPVVRMAAMVLPGVIIYVGLMLLLDRLTVLRVLSFFRNALTRPAGHPAERAVKLS